MITLDNITKGGVFTVFWPGQAFTYKVMTWENNGKKLCSVSMKVGLDVKFVGFLNLDTFQMNVKDSAFKADGFEVRAICRALARLVAKESFPDGTGIKVAS